MSTFRIQRLDIEMCQRTGCKSYARRVVWIDGEMQQRLCAHHAFMLRLSLLDRGWRER